MGGAPTDAEIRKRIEALGGGQVGEIEPLVGGANNRLWRAEVAGEAVVAKLYHRGPTDRRDRLGAEFGMLGHLWRGGLRCIPEPLAADAETGLGLYRFVEGRVLLPAELGAPEASALADLLAEMRRLRDAPGADALPTASEATFSDTELLALLDRRLARLQAALAEDPDAGAARGFVEDSLAPALAERGGALRTRSGHPEALPRAERTLSPSDHGFHNTLRRPDGSLVFLDFEYAGWDDPAKMLADACLQPQVPLPATLRGRFIADMLARLEGGPPLALRLRSLYPVYALKWCLILLNEFVPVDRARRRFAGADAAGRRDLQLEKARQMLEASDDRAFLPGADCDVADPERGG